MPSYFAVPTLLALCAGTPVLAAQWSPDAMVNQAVASFPGDQVLPKAAATSDGGDWVGWFDARSGGYEVYVQRYDAKGTALLAAGGLLVSSHPQSTSLVDWDLIADSGDNAVLVFTDTRTGGDLDVYAYRIGSDGSFLWGPDGVTVSKNTSFEADPKVAQADNGDFVVVWGYFPSGGGRVRMQRLDGSGAALLAPGGADVVVESGRSPGFADLVPSDNGSVIVSWVRDTSFATSVKHIRAQRFDAAGAPVWPAPVEVFNAYNLPIAYLPQILADGADGAVLCWHASNPGAGFLFDAFVQRLDAQGQELYPHNGVSVCTTAGRNHLNPDASFVAASGDIVVFWNEEDAGQSQGGWYAQKVDTAGTRAWGNGGVEILPVDNQPKYPPRSVPLADGAVGVMTWTPGAQFGHDQVVSVRLDGSGTAVWSGGTRALCALPSLKSARLALSAHADGEAVVFWEDSRNGDPDVYGQNVHPDGTLGAHFLSVDPDQVSLALGGLVQMSLDAGAAHAGQDYELLGTTGGTSPGVDGHGVHLPLNPSHYLRTTLHNPDPPGGSGFRGSLDAAGRASATLLVPPGPGTLAGRKIAHAYVVLDATGAVVLVSEPRSFVLVP